MSSAPDPRISKIFYYFEQHTNIGSGRTVGRKIGVVQEILCKKLLLTSQAIRDSVIYEPKIKGRSKASHKVEFVLFQPAKVFEIGTGQEAVIEANLSIKVTAIDANRGKAKVVIRDRNESKRCTVDVDKLVGGTARALITAHGLDVRLSELTSSHARLAILERSSPVASIESKRVGAQRFSSSDQLGSGIQTIEKAKQASLVAVDFDLEYNGNLMAITGHGSQRKYRSFVVLGNGVHWTQHDLAILETYVDYSYLATDDAIIRYADFVRDFAQSQNQPFFNYFMSYFQGMTKTAPDRFKALESDFEPMRPTNAPTLLKAVEAQIQPYSVIRV